MELRMKGAGRHYGVTNRHNLCEESGRARTAQSTHLPLSAPHVPHSQIHSRALTASKRYQEESVTDAFLSQPGCFFTVSIETLPLFCSWMEKGASSNARGFPRAAGSAALPFSLLPPSRSPSQRRTALHFEKMSQDGKAYLPKSCLGSTTCNRHG